MSVELTPNKAPFEYLWQAPEIFESRPALDSETSMWPGDSSDRLFGNEYDFLIVRRTHLGDRSLTLVLLEKIEEVKQIASWSCLESGLYSMSVPHASWKENFMRAHQLVARIRESYRYDPDKSEMEGLIELAKLVESQINNQEKAEA